jgi:hypothetical protein
MRLRNRALVLIRPRLGGIKQKPEIRREAVEGDAARPQLVQDPEPRLVSPTQPPELKRTRSPGVRYSLSELIDPFTL